MIQFFAPLSVLAACLFYVNEPVVNMRENPTPNSKVVSQACFSEKITAETTFEDWTYISTPDHYFGWVPTNSFVVADRPYEASLKVSRLAAHVYEVNDVKFGPLKTLPYGSQLQLLDESDPRWIKIALPDGKEGYIQRGDVAPEETLQGKDELVAFSQKFLGLPYTWGGRSSFGYDCSGFVQMLYGKIGIALPRDSGQQAIDERFQTIPVEALEPGDLIFFGRSEGKVSHVGMYLGEGRFIHATSGEGCPWIRVSNLADFEWSGKKESPRPYRIARQWMTRFTPITQTPCAAYPGRDLTD